MTVQDVSRPAATHILTTEDASRPKQRSTAVCDKPEYRLQLLLQAGFRKLDHPPYQYQGFPCTSLSLHEYGIIVWCALTVPQMPLEKKQDRSNT
ncbi:hypothetical protein IG631_21324 [Alternaria alternata]|nr:hypothetical protein IG631_21324 [Alternaria alternata]